MIKRLDTHESFAENEEVHYQHGVFSIDDKEICMVKIISQNSAIVMLNDHKFLDELIQEFRYYAEHITIFYDEKLSILKEFPPIQLKEIDLLAIQPSQFYINEAKMAAISTFVQSAEDVIIPVNRQHEDYVAVDGHTRLYVAYKKGLKKVYIFETDLQEEIDDFVQAAQRRKIRNIKDCIVLNDEAYKKEWIGYCEAYYNNKKG